MRIETPATGATLRNTGNVLSVYLIVMEKRLRPKPISEAERQWINAQGDFGKRCFAYPGDDMPTNNVFSLDYYRAMTRKIVSIDYDSNEA